MVSTKTRTAGIPIRGGQAVLTSVGLYQRICPICTRMDSGSKLLEDKSSILAKRPMVKLKGGGGSREQH